MRLKPAAFRAMVAKGTSAIAWDRVKDWLVNLAGALIASTCTYFVATAQIKEKYAGALSNIETLNLKVGIQEGLFVAFTNHIFRLEATNVTLQHQLVQEQSAALMRENAFKQDLVLAGEKLALLEAGSKTLFSSQNDFDYFITQVPQLRTDLLHAKQSLGQFEDRESLKLMSVVNVLDQMEGGSLFILGEAIKEDKRIAISLIKGSSANNQRRSGVARIVNVMFLYIPELVRSHHELKRRDEADNTYGTSLLSNAEKSQLALSTLRPDRLKTLALISGERKFLPEVSSAIDRGVRFLDELVQRNTNSLPKAVSGRSVAFQTR